MMATIVLAGLIYFVCEVYLDDIIIYGTGEKQFLQRLDTVVERLLHKRINLIEFINAPSSLILFFSLTTFLLCMANCACKSS